MSKARSPVRIGLAIGVVVAAVLFALVYFQSLPLSDEDRAALVLSKDIGFPAKQENETLSKRRTWSGATELHYRAHGLGKREIATLDETNFAYFARTSALTGFAGIKIGGRSGFALAAAKTNRCASVTCASRGPTTAIGPTIAPRSVRSCWSASAARCISSA
jgi:hypothetical protein